MFRLFLLSVVVVPVVILGVCECTRAPDPLTQGMPTRLSQTNYRIVWIELSEDHTAEDLFALNFNIDVWEISRKHIIAKATDEVVRAVRKKGYPTIILYVSVGDYLAAVSAGDDPIRVARIDCQPGPECQSLNTPGMITGILEQRDNYVIVKVTLQQLVSLLRQGYDAHLIYATEQEYLDSINSKGGKT